jgi:aryl-alcohol dehydrogenase-like predicted oxidoreductase
VLVSIGDARGISAAQVALAWLLGRPGVSSLVVGGRSEEQFLDNFGAVGLTLTPEELARLNEVSRPPLIYPYWHQGNFATARFSAADWALHDSYRE